MLKTKLETQGVKPDFVGKALQLFAKSLPSKAAVMEKFENAIPDFNRVHSLWANTPLSRMALTAVGKVLAFSIVTAKTPFNAPLDIWVS